MKPQSDVAQIAWLGQKLPEVSDTQLDLTLARPEHVSKTLILRADLIVVDVKPPQQAIQLLKDFRQRSPAKTLVALVYNWSAHQIQEVTNQKLCDKLIVGTADLSEQSEILKQVLHIKQKKFNQQKVLDEVRQQSSQLTELKTNLEAMVKRRTHSAVESKRQVTQTGVRIRELGAFIGHLGRLMTLDDVMHLMRQQIRHFHDVIECVALIPMATQSRLYYFRADTLFDKFTHQQIGPKVQARQFLANELGRPIGTVLIKSIQLTQSQRDLQIFFEHRLKKDKLDEFNEFIQERLHPLGLTIDRLVIESELKMASRIWEKTFDGIQEPVAIIDCEYQLLRSNKHFSFVQDQAYCYQQFNRSERACAGCPLSQSFESQGAAEGMVRRAGSMYRVHSYPIMDSSKPTRATAVINHYVDITRSMKLQSQMIQLEKMAALGHLADNVAHELNNPLTGVRSLSQLLLHQYANDPQIVSDLKEIESASSRCQVIINNLLEYARGGLEAKTSLQDLNEIVRRTLPLLKTATGKFTCQFDFAKTALHIRVEPHLVQQVVFNLVNNACQAMGAHGQLNLRTYSQGGNAVLEVADSGPGIPAELQEAIFEPFFTTKGENEGTGLGLSMSREFVRQFGGEISLQSSPGSGAKFYIRFPESH